MLESLFLCVIGFGILMTILTALDRDEIAWSILAIPTWLICSVTVSDLERPYAFLSNGVVTEGIFHYSGGAFMQYFFGGLAIVFVIIFFNNVLAMYRESTKSRGKLK